MIKATTEHGTYYLIDLETGVAQRIKGEDRNEMYGDGDWFEFSSVSAYDRETMESVEGGIQVGYSMFFWLRGPRYYDWRISTDVTSIKEI